MNTILAVLFVVFSVVGIVAGYIAAVVIEKRRKRRDQPKQDIEERIDSTLKIVLAKQRIHNGTVVDHHQHRGR